MGVIGWRMAMDRALYRPGGFFAAGGTGPAGHFRTSVHASPLFAGALLRLIEQVDAALGHPDRFDVVDVGAGRGELLSTLLALLPGPPDPTRTGPPDPGRTHTPDSGRQVRPLRSRARLSAVEIAPRPVELDGHIGWRRNVPASITGMLIATEWLDNVPLDLAEVDENGRARLVLVNPATGDETLGGVVDAADAFWLARWWPLDHLGGPTDGRDARPGARAEIGWPRDVAWADAVAGVRRGAALAVDYGHLRTGRPGFGTLTGFRGGRQVTPVPDGSCDVTAHVAMDAAARAVGSAYTLITQREALKALGVDGARPPLELARTDPAGYLRALSAAGAGAELIDPAGLGGHWWLLHTVGIDGVGSFRCD